MVAKEFLRRTIGSSSATVKIEIFKGYRHRISKAEIKP